MKAWNAAAGWPVGSRAGSKPGPPGPGLTWPVTQEDRFSFMEEMSLVPLSLRLGLCGGRQLLREGEAWAAPPNLTQEPPGWGSSLAPEPFPSLTHKAACTPSSPPSCATLTGMHRHPHCWVRKQAREREKLDKSRSARYWSSRRVQDCSDSKVRTSHQPSGLGLNPGAQDSHRLQSFSVIMWWMNQNTLCPLQGQSFARDSED